MLDLGCIRASFVLGLDLSVIFLRVAFIYFLMLMMSVCVCMRAGFALDALVDNYGEMEGWRPCSKKKKK